MKKNMGNADRYIRVLLAIVLILLFALNILTGTLGYIALAVGIVFLLTSFVSFCPLYALVGFNTCGVKKV